MNPIIHFEMPAKDKKRMMDFYSQTFGWQTKMTGPEMGEYVLVTTTETDEKTGPKKPGAINGGFYQYNADNPSQQQPSVVVSVKNIQKHMAKVTSAGGKVIGEPVEIPGVGAYVCFQDTEGNYLSMLQPKMIQ